MVKCTHRKEDRRTQTSMHNPQPDSCATRSDTQPCSTIKPNTKGEDIRLSSCHTCCQSQLISKAITGSLSHRCRLMVSACPLRLGCHLLKANWLCDHSDEHTLPLSEPIPSSVYSFRPSLPPHLINTLLSAGVGPSFVMLSGCVSQLVFPP